MKWWKSLAILAILGAQIGPAHADDECGEPSQIPQGQAGPFDYRAAPEERKRTVEGLHFTPDVEALRKGSTTVNIGEDLSFTLMVFPNHHRALRAMSNLGLKLKTNRPPGAQFTVNCFFERALLFRPDDAVARMIYGTHLLRIGKPDSAVRELERANEAMPDNSNLLYNLGLAYFHTKDYDKSLRCAKEAYALGFPLPGLRDMLKRAGQWRD